ncbi:MAG: carbohydrate kinase family protein [Planctomycetota bacterium]|jgi:fructokinase
MDQQFTIVGLGEILWDLFEDGKLLGGAPCNAAYHAAALGHRGVPLSRIGEDRLGDELVGAVEALGVPVDFLQRDPDHPTGTVRVSVEEGGSPEFVIAHDVAWDYMEPDDRWLELAEGADAICFGTLAQRSAQSRTTIQQVLAAAAGAVRVYDVNFRQHFYSRDVVTESLAAANVLKLNEQEVGLLRTLLHPDSGTAPAGFVRALIADYGLDLACITLGERGCLLVTSREEVARPVPPTRTMDSVGSGDAFTAGLVVKLLEGAPPASIAEGANLLGAYVAGRRGAAPPLSDELLERFRAL